MTPDQLQQANKINSQITLIDEMEKEVARFKKTRFSGSLPTSVSRFIRDNPDVAMKVVDMVMTEAVSKRVLLQGQWNNI